MTHRIRPPSAKRLFRFAARSRQDIQSTMSQEEFAFHLDMRIDDLMRPGLSEPDARAQALREFGDQSRGAPGMRNERS